MTRRHGAEGTHDGPVDAQLVEAGNRAVKAGRAESLSSWINDVEIVAA